jgi:hypothetical protein
MSAQGELIVIPAKFTEDVRADFWAQNRLDFCRIVRIAMGVGRRSRRIEGSPRDLPGLWVVRASIPAPQSKGAQTMPTLSIEKTQNLESTAPKKGGAKPNAPSRRKVPSVAASPQKPLRSVGLKTARVTAVNMSPTPDEPGVKRVTRHKKPPRSPESQRTRSAAAKIPSKVDEPNPERATKQDRMLTLLSRPEGVSIEEMMQATDWQQHSVRGFLAGTVKKKLGFALTSSKPDGGIRRYRIETRRGR